MAARANTQAPITWRDGIHIAGTAIWCDALRTRDICFVSSAHAIANARHGQFIATAPTLALLDPSGARGSHLSVPYGRPFTLGTVRLELIHSGHGVGGAGLLATVDGYRILYCRDIDPNDGDGDGDGAESRRCDALVLGAHYGHPGFEFPARDEAVLAVRDFVQETIDAGAAAVLLVSSASKALQVARRLSASLAGRLADGIGPTFFAQRGIYDAAQRLAGQRDGEPRIRRFAGRLPTGHILLWPMTRRAQLTQRGGRARIALVSGAACDAALVGQLSVDTAFAWSDRADHDDLLQYIEKCRPTQVFLTGAYAESMSARHSRSARPWHALTAPRQIELFRALE